VIELKPIDLGQGCYNKATNAHHSTPRLLERAAAVPSSLARTPFKVARASLHMFSGALGISGLSRAKDYLLAKEAGKSS
jgi:hypothetical protein